MHGLRETISFIQGNALFSWCFNFQEKVKELEGEVVWLTNTQPRIPLLSLVQFSALGDSRGLYL